MAERKTPEQKLEELEKKMEQLKAQKKAAHLQKNIFVVKKSNLPTLKNCFKSWLRLTQ